MSWLLKDQEIASYGKFDLSWMQFKSHVTMVQK